MASVVGRLGRQRRYGLSYVAGFIALIYQVGLRPWDFLVRTKRFDVQGFVLISLLATTPDGSGVRLCWLAIEVAG